MWNPSEVKDTSSTVPDGDYLVQCMGVSFLRNKKTKELITDRDGNVTGDKTLELQFAIIGGEYKKKHVFTSLSFDMRRWAEHPIGEIIFAKFCQAAETGPIDLEQSESAWQRAIKGRVFKIKFTSKEDKNGYMRTHINAVRTLNDEEKAIKQSLEFDAPSGSGGSTESSEDLDGIPF